jgi:dipeptidyl aminopeptidase/acylaminoacyl peptidase
MFSRAPQVLPYLTTLAFGALLAGCEPEIPPNVPTAGTAAPSAAPAPTPSADPTAPAPASPASVPYAGHGLSSLSPEALAKFAPIPLPSDVSRRIQAMLDVRAPSAGRLSPDGKVLYFGWTISGTNQLWRLDGPQRFPVQMTGGEDATSLTEITPDGRHLILSRDRKGEENPGLYLQDAKGGPLAVIQHKPGVQTSLEFVTDDSKAIYFRANDIKNNSYAIYRYDIEKKQRELVFDQEGLWEVSDFRPDGRLLLAKQVGGNMAEMFEWNPKTRVLSPLFGQGEREDYNASYGAADGEIIVQTPKFSEFRRLYQWKAGKFSPISPELKFDVQSFSIDHQKQRILYQVNEGGFTRLRGMDAKSFREIKLPSFPPSDHVNIGPTTRSGAFSTFSIDTGKGPRVSYSVDWKTTKLTAWHTPSSPETDTTRFAAAKLEFYPARDGTPIPMFVRRPASCDKPCPVVVSFHGGPEGQSVPGFSSRSQIFVDAGFILVEPNVRGSEGYGKTWLHADDGPKRLNVITDIEDCAKFIRQNWGEGGKAPKIGITGGSYGGYATLIGMTMFAGAFDAGAEIVGISNLVTFLQNTAPYRRALRASEYGDPEKDREALTKLSPITYIDQVKGPLLLVQGANDPRVPAGEAVQIYNALDARKLPTKLIIFPDEGHGAGKRENQVLMLGHTVRFLQEHLQGKKVP